jgi:carbon storage regulator
MLVLSRKVGEKILVGKDVWLTVVQIDGNKVRIGFEAPQDVPIIRNELIPRNEPQKPSN